MAGARRLWVIVFSAGATFILLKLVGLFVPLRMSEEDMETGDLAVHGHEVYPSDIPSLAFPSGAPTPRPSPAPARHRPAGAAGRSGGPRHSARNLSIRSVDTATGRSRGTRWPRRSSFRYDGTDNDHDALALGSLLAGPAGALELAYVRHAHEVESGRERLVEKDAEALLAAGAAVIGRPDIPQHVSLSASTPEGLRALALDEEASVIVFGSEYRTAKNHVDPQPSARRLLDGGPAAVAIAPAGFAEVEGYEVKSIVAVGEDGDPCALETAESLARAGRGATVAAGTSRDVGGRPDFLVVGSKPGTVNGRVTLSAAAEYLIELARCPVLVLPRGVAVSFG